MNTYSISDYKYINVTDDSGELWWVGEFSTCLQGQHKYYIFNFSKEEGNLDRKEFERAAFNCSGDIDVGNSLDFFIDYLLGEN